MEEKSPEEKLSDAANELLKRANKETQRRVAARGALDRCLYRLWNGFRDAAVILKKNNVDGSLGGDFVRSRDTSFTFRVKALDASAELSVQGDPLRGAITVKSRRHGPHPELEKLNTSDPFGTEDLPEGWPFMVTLWLVESLRWPSDEAD